MSEKLFDQKDMCYLFKDILFQNAAFFKTRESESLIKILNSYKLTVIDNTPQEESIVPNPEIIGRIFENLLAIHNPETQKTIRKQSSYFYTTNKIVNYMADGSLTAYLLEKADGDWENNKIFGSGLRFRRNCKFNRGGYGLWLRSCLHR
ncbi:hypothetical protein R80B4_00267 [Fibrobacteres bacterium R8-0-B4]